MSQHYELDKIHSYISKIGQNMSRSDKIFNLRPGGCVLIGVVLLVVVYVCFYISGMKEDVTLYEGPRDLGKPGFATPQQEFDRLWDYIYKQQYMCSEFEILGGRKLDRDGAYALCTEDRFWPYNQPSTMKQKCLLYSFGIGDDFTFDDEIAKKGCEVHSFDPSMDNPADGFVRESGVIFHKIGIASKDEDANKFGWKMRTLKTLVKELSHNGRYIDYLKVDTDNPDGGGFEEQVMDELLETGLYKCVRQFGMEIHLPGPIVNPGRLELCRKVYRQLTTLNKHGYRLFSTTDNVRYERIVNDPNFSQLTKKNEIVNQGGTILWEVVFVNFNVQPCEV